MPTIDEWGNWVQDPPPVAEMQAASRAYEAMLADPDATAEAITAARERLEASAAARLEMEEAIEREREAAAAERERTPRPASDSAFTL